MSSELLNLGAVAIIFLFAVREFFAYLKAKKSEPTNGNGNMFSKAIFDELSKMNNNHLHSIQEAIERGNREMIDTMHNDSSRMIELLGEIKGMLSNYR